MKLDQTIKQLEEIGREHGPAAFASSLGAEDMVLTDLILRHGFPIEIFTLDTGRLHAETLAVISKIREKYSYELKVIKPIESQVNEYVSSHGLNAFYESVELRKECCRIRKLVPLKMALEGKKAWITGLRRAQSTGRAQLSTKEFDEANGLMKFNPLADWEESEVWSYLKENNVPYNSLHDRGYPSIGCEPCTRAVKPDEDIRAGRWWWEGETLKKECGLHLSFKKGN